MIGAFPNPLVGDDHVHVAVGGIDRDAGCSLAGIAWLDRRDDLLGDRLPNAFVGGR
jgi:hypothetical protein